MLLFGTFATFSPLINKAQATFVVSNRSGQTNIAQHNNQPKEEYNADDSESLSFERTGDVIDDIRSIYLAQVETNEIDKGYGKPLPVERVVSPEEFEPIPTMATNGKVGYL